MNFLSLSLTQVSQKYFGVGGSAASTPSPTSSPSNRPSPYLFTFPHLMVYIRHPRQLTQAKMFSSGGFGISLDGKAAYNDFPWQWAEDRIKGVVFLLLFCFSPPFVECFPLIWSFSNPLGFSLFENIVDFMFGSFHRFGYPFRVEFTTNWGFIGFASKVLRHNFVPFKESPLSGPCTILGKDKDH